MSSRLPDEVFLVSAAPRELPLLDLPGWTVRPRSPSRETIDDVAIRGPALLVAHIGERDAVVLPFLDDMARTIGPLAPPVLALVAGDDEDTFARTLASIAEDVIAAPPPPALLRTKVALLARRERHSVAGLAGHRVSRVLGQGATGTVYLAEKDGRRVALKVVDLALCSKPDETVARFEREARVLATVEGPGIPRFVEAGRAGDQLYCAMEYVPGQDLHAAIAHGPLPERAIERLVDQVAETLEVIHRAGLVHRDVKPGNIILSPDGRARLVDFGLAKSPADAGLTSATSVLGTLPYMPPELLRGEGVGPWTDAFALGMTALEAACGHALVRGSKHEIVSRRAAGQVPRAAELLAGRCRPLTETIEGLLDPDPICRLSPGEARSRLRACRTGCAA